jgi:hypothetical protein
VTRERDIEKYLVHRVKAMGGEVRKVQWIGRRGAPDRLVMLPWTVERCSDTTYWVELKASGAKAAAYQLREHDRMRKMGQEVRVVDSLAGVDELLA